MTSKYVFRLLRPLAKFIFWIFICISDIENRWRFSVFKPEYGTFVEGTQIYDFIFQGTLDVKIIIVKDHVCRKYGFGATSKPIVFWIVLDSLIKSWIYGQNIYWSCHGLKFALKCNINYNIMGKEHGNYGW